MKMIILVVKKFKADVQNKDLIRSFAGDARACAFCGAFIGGIKAQLPLEVCEQCQVLEVIIVYVLFQFVALLFFLRTRMMSTKITATKGEARGVCASYWDRFD